MNYQKSLTIIVAICCIPFVTKSQSIGGYSLYGHLASAVHPYGCSDGHVTHFPDDSLWVNLDNDTTTGFFTFSDVDSVGYDLLLETGYNTSNYTVSLLLSNGLYSSSHSVSTSDWVSLGNLTWISLYTSLTCNQISFTAPHFITPLDFNLDFGLLSTDTVIGIKIAFLLSAGGPDFAGAYLINLQQVGINEQSLNSLVSVSLNLLLNKINITARSNKIHDAFLYDIAGRMVFNQSFVHSISINTEHLNKGLYFYKVINRDGLCKKGKLVKD